MNWSALTWKHIAILVIVVAVPLTLTLAKKTDMIGVVIAGIGSLATAVALFLKSLNSAHAPDDTAKGAPKPPPLPMFFMILVTCCPIVLLPWACSPAAQRQIMPANPTAADCLAERAARQSNCIRLYTTDPEIQTCLDRVRAAINCSTEAGVAAWAGTSDGGAG